MKKLVPFAALLCGAVFSFIHPLGFAADVEPHSKVKVCNPAETFCVDVDSSNRLKAVAANNDVSAANSTTTPLGSNATFTGSFEDVLAYSDVTVSLKADVASADGGFVIQWSADGSTVLDSDVYSLAANTGKQYSLGTMARYVRIVYTNGSSAQSSFSLQTIYKRTRGKPSSHRMGDSVRDDDDAELVKAGITGKSPSGVHLNVKVDEDGRLETSGVSSQLSPLPAFVARTSKVISAGVMVLSTYTMTDDIAIIDFHFGGRGPGQAAIFRLDESASEFVPSGNFETNGDVTTTWSNTSIGDEALTAWTRSTAQFSTGTSSAAKAFLKSDSNNYPEISYTWSTPQDMNTWRYIKADVRVTVASGGGQSRTVSIILEDVNGATRTYSISGTTNTAPFSTEQWQTLTAEIESPTSSTGTFDPYNVSKIRLRLVDGGNKTGTIYWDNVHFEDSQSLIERIYIDANRTFQLILDPAELFDTGQVLGMRMKNNDTVPREFTVTAKGVER